jgi:hypothetical protein
LPPNYADDLLKKPSVQRAARAAYNKFAPLDTPLARGEYVNFYAYLNKLVDKHIMTVLDTLEEYPERPRRAAQPALRRAHR